ncbi:MAG: lipoprotein-releasing ABC transporter permease subunit [Candidatus Accumulibacter sp.]|jgi:lipoprotein-releasing system permease protein|nr:lipoprotein-releasing ABC transporter permease subunit [Accumulibacter sp.]
MTREPAARFFAGLPFELVIGLRYIRAKRRNHFISFISLISMLGIALGVAALIIVLSVMNGFQSELRERILSVVSHVQITGLDGGMADWESVARQASSAPGVVASAPYVQEQGMLSSGASVRGTVIRGILPDSEDKVADFRPHMRRGQLESLVPGEFSIILGRELARALEVSVGDKITLIAPRGAVTPAGIMPRLKTFTVSGIFEAGMIEFDSGLALIRLEDAQKLYRLEDRVSGVRLKLDDLFNAPFVTRYLVNNLNSPAYISDWTRSHANFFHAVQIEKNMMLIILSLIVAVAAFNLVSTLVMAVTDKRPDIAILRTLGASSGSVMTIFIVQGALTGFIGLVLGILLGVSGALNIEAIVPVIERMLGVQLWSPEVYYISSLPSELQWRDVFIITCVSFALSLMATLYPSWSASRVNPAEALRYE